MSYLRLTARLPVKKFCRMSIQTRKSSNYTVTTHTFANITEKYFTYKDVFVVNKLDWYSGLLAPTSAGHQTNQTDRFFFRFWLSSQRPKRKYWSPIVLKLPTRQNNFWPFNAGVSSNLSSNINLQTNITPYIYSTVCTVINKLCAFYNDN